ncbi:MAG TPA: STAS domain-containing protein [Bryobacteraceae bacterium]|jgi:stage II sporulation protein AA (anti-sigma F factor antagonist)
MEVKTKREGNTAVVSISGRLDAVTAEDYRTAVRVLVETGTTRVVVDLQELNYISSGGMSALVLSARWLKEKDGRFAVAGLRGPVQSVLEMSGIAKLLNVHASVAEALAGVA